MFQIKISIGKNCKIKIIKKTYFHLNEKKNLSSTLFHTFLVEYEKIDTLL